MSEGHKVRELPLAPVRETQPDATQAPEQSATAQAPAARRRHLRGWLLALGPLVLLLAGAYYLLTTGRYVGTDNAYVNAHVVALSAEVGGTIRNVDVVENQHVRQGEVLFRIDPASYRIALARAEAGLGTARTRLDALKANYRQKQEELTLAETNADFARRELERRSQLAKQRLVSENELDTARNTLDTARQQVAVVRQQRAEILAELLGDADLPAERFPDYRAALAAREQAQLDLARTEVRAPFDGIASHVPDPGQYLAPGTAVMSLVAEHEVWIDANYKETELTYVRPGQPVSISVDTYPGRTWRGVVQSVSPATGAQFSVLPAQNATGNWVKVVQRIAVRIAVHEEAGAPPLRAGMSTEVEIDTGHRGALPAFLHAVASWFSGGRDSASPARAEG